MKYVLFFLMSILWISFCFPKEYTENELRGIVSEASRAPHFDNKVLLDAVIQIREEDRRELLPLIEEVKEKKTDQLQNPSEIHKRLSSTQEDNKILLEINKTEKFLKEDFQPPSKEPKITIYIGSFFIVVLLVFFVARRKG